MIQIGIDADLNMVDDDDRNLAVCPSAPRGSTSATSPSPAGLASGPGFWSMRLPTVRCSSTKAAGEKLDALLQVEESEVDVMVEEFKQLRRKASK